MGTVIALVALAGAGYLYLRDQGVLASTPIQPAQPAQAPTVAPSGSRTQQIIGASVGTATAIGGLLSTGGATAAGVGASGAGAAEVAAGGSGGGSALGSAGAFLVTNPIGWAVLGGIGATAGILAFRDNHNDHRDQINDTLRNLATTYILDGESGPVTSRPDYTQVGPTGHSWAGDDVPGTFWLLNVLTAADGDASIYYNGLTGAKDDDMLKSAFRMINDRLIKAVNQPGQNRDPRAAKWAQLTLDAQLNSRHDWIKDRTREALGVQ